MASAAWWLRGPRATQGARARGWGLGRSGEVRLALRLGCARARLALPPGPSTHCHRTAHTHTSLHSACRNGRPGHALVGQSVRPDRRLRP